MVDSIQAYIYIYHLGLKFNLPTLPEQLTDNFPIEFSQQQVLSRSAPQITWSSAGPRTSNVVVRIHRQLFDLENKNFQNLTEFLPAGQGVNDLGLSTDKATPADTADLLINALIALSLPKYSDADKAITPPSVLVRYGNEFCIRGVPANVVKTSNGPWLKNGKMSLVDVSFQITETEPYSADYAFQNGSLRSISLDLTRSNVWQ